jgi:UDP-N-acetylmuramoylalanine--D-glutamate ligase
MDLRNKNVLVVGMGKSGLAAIDLLREQGAIVEATDSKEFDQLPPEVRERLDSVEFHVQSADLFARTSAARIVLSPGVPVETVPEDKRPRVLGEVELASYFLKGKSIGITGSNGKTTTTALIGHILQHCGIPCQVGGNIGTPPTAMIASSADDQWNVLELSSYQLETISHFRAAIGVCLNLTQDHLDRHKTMENYAAAKGKLFDTQTESEYAVLNADDQYCTGYAAEARSKAVWFSLKRRVAHNGMWLDEDGRLQFDGGVFMLASEIPLRGMHNVENVMAASLAAMLAGADPAGVREAVMQFRGVEHRLEFVRRVGGVAYYNDSKATNVDATLKALDAFPGSLWVILGGKDKDSDYKPLFEPLSRKARAALLVGAAASKIANQIAGACRTEMCGTIQDAIALASREALPGDTVLLAPACASFDQFQSFEHRGRVFKALVHELKEA